jgi:hypothetical protein
MVGFMLASKTLLRIMAFLTIQYENAFYEIKKPTPTTGVTLRKLPLSFLIPDQQPCICGAFFLRSHNGKRPHSTRYNADTAFN